MKPILLLALLLITSLSALPAAETKPDIVFIIADDLGWADVAFHSGNAPTPNLDRLKSNGVELTQHYVAPVCSPTRAGLMTGRCWSRFGVTTPANERALPWDTATLPRALKNAGYDTCLTGKWHLGSKPEEGPNHFGFDHSYGSLAGGVSPWNHRYKQGPFSITWHRDEKLIEEKGHVTDLIAAEATKWIESRGDAPFFLYVPFTAVHLPVKEPAEWVAKVPAGITDDVARHYAASVMHLDDAIGRIITALEKKGRSENTIVVFTSDNGGSTVENNDLKYPDDNCPSGKLPGNNLPLRGQKGSVYEGGTRVPTLLSWPAKLKPGTFNGVAQITDWMPTLCALAEAKPTQDLKWDGINLWPQLSGTEPVKPRVIYTVGPGFNARAVRDGDWKLIVSRKGGSKKSETDELFDLATDPNETTDLAAKMPEKVAALRAQINKLAKADRDALPSASEKPESSSSNAASQSWQTGAAEHARILSQVRWTPVAGTMPNRKGGFFESGKENVGVPYSSVRSEGRYIGFDIGLRTFLAAVENPQSVLYTENLTGKVSNAAAYYGSVCSAYTSYALGCGIWEVSRRYGPQISDGIRLVEPQSADAAQAGDVIYTPHTSETSGSHVEMVTAVIKDAAGRVISVSVDESRPPTTATTERSAAAFNAHLASRNRQLFRITDREAWRGANHSEPLLFPNYEADAAKPTINRALLLDLGDWVPYQKGKPVKFNVMDRDQLGVKSLFIRRGDQLLEEIALEGPGVHERTLDISGDYTAQVIHRDGKPSQACEFAVCDLKLTLPKDQVSMKGGWEVVFSAENIKPIVIYLWNEADSYGRHPLFLTDEQRRAGSLTIPADLLKKPGKLQVWLIGEHKLGRLKLRKDITMVP